MKRETYEKLCSSDTVNKKTEKSIENSTFEIPIVLVDTIVNDEQNNNRKKVINAPHVANLAVLIKDSNKTCSSGYPINEIPIDVMVISGKGKDEDRYVALDGHHRLSALKNLRAENVFATTWMDDESEEHELIMNKEIENDHRNDSLPTDDKSREANIIKMVSEANYFRKLPEALVPTDWGDVETPIIFPNDDASAETIDKWRDDCSKIYKNLLPNCVKDRRWIKSCLEKGRQRDKNAKMYVKAATKEQIYSLVRTGQNPTKWSSDDFTFSKEAVAETVSYKGDEWRVIIASSERHFTKDCLASAHAAKTKNPDLKILVCYGTCNLNNLHDSTAQGDRLRVIRAFDRINNSKLHQGSGMKLFDNICFYPQIILGPYKDADQHRMTTRAEVMAKEEAEGRHGPAAASA